MPFEGGQPLSQTPTTPQPHPSHTPASLQPHRTSSPAAHLAVPFEGGQSPDGVADVLGGEVGQLMHGMVAQQLQEVAWGVVGQGGICPNHVGHALRLEGMHEGAAVPGCCRHQFWVKLACRPTHKLLQSKRGLLCNAAAVISCLPADTHKLSESKRVLLCNAAPVVSSGQSLLGDPQAANHA